MTENTEEKTSKREVIKLLIHLPGKKEKIELQSLVSGSIEDVASTITSLSTTNCFTCFKLATLEGFELDSQITLEELLEGEDIEVLELVLKEMAYTERDAREHIKHVRNVVDLEPVGSSNFGVNAGSSRFALLNLDPVSIKSPNEDTEEAKETENTTAETEKKESAKKPELSDEEKRPISEFVKSFFDFETDTKKVSLTAHANSLKLSLKPAVEAIVLSSWNPPTPRQKLNGDLLYLYVQTIEGEVYHITSHVSGFFVNKSTFAKFDGSSKTLPNSQGKPRVNKSHSLLSLLNNLSPALNRQLVANRELLAKFDSAVYQPATNATLANPWIVDLPLDAPHPDLAKTQSLYVDGGIDGADLIRDWNDDYQNIREMPKSTFQERNLRERLLNKTSADFTEAAIKTAISIVNKEFLPLNPENKPEEHIFLRNGIFYSLAVDGVGQFAKTGGDEAARAATNRDLASIRYLNRLDVSNVCHLCTAIVDYCGQRVLCQTPVPGIFTGVASDTDGDSESESPSDVLYGGSEANTRLSSNEKFVPKLKPIAQAFHLKEHKVWTKDGSQSTSLVTSIETKGMKGNDGRSYIMDLYRTSPLDIEFIEAHYNPDADSSYPHREVTLRHEAIEEWWRRQVSVLVNNETQKLEEKSSEDSASEKGGEKKPVIAIDPDACTLNPDAFSLNKAVAPSPEDLKELEEDESRVREVSKFVTEILIPEFLDNIADSNIITPIDGAHLSTLLHTQGINIRYLGVIASMIVDRLNKYENELIESRKKIEGINEALEKKKAEARKQLKEQKKKSEDSPKEESNEDSKEETTDRADFYPVKSSLKSLLTVVTQEIIARSTKHLLRKQIASLPLPFAPYVITHIFNCLLGSKFNPEPKIFVDENLSIYDADLSFTQWTSKDVVELISKEAYVRFRYIIPDTWFTEINEIVLLREISTKFGLQIKGRNYQFTAARSTEAEVTPESKQAKKGRKTKELASEVSTNITTTGVFSVDDIVAIVPIVKESTFRSTLVEEVWESGRTFIAKKENEQGVALLNQATTLYEQVYGPVHKEVADAYSLLAQNYAELSSFGEAATLSRRSVNLTERTAGFDSYSTVLALISSGYFENQNGDYLNSLKIYKNALQLWKTISVMEHPTVISTLESVASNLQNLGLHAECLAVLEYVLKLSAKVNDEDSTITALQLFKRGQTKTLLEDFKGALADVSTSYKIFRKNAGIDDSTTAWIYKLMSQLTKYSVITAQEQQKMKPNGERVNKKSSKSAEKKKATTSTDETTPDPVIANQSIEEIMNFIEGTAPSIKK
ncbi:eIF3 component of unknown function [Komagataella phaffii CBS 7435]|uniref:Clu domain-containing protein n=2 Tax=Komagataella phaffii TaxID=460519 RepID=C4R5Z7_KOMPG|nr:uncharacterized protein PAS_chr3_0925 [Komagataella phaffii GS115]CAH2449199.1 eIF3 component of unknown function [Komagataella phaffii CBS 7435]CAY70983.1 eIF3 component of unknown function [Komagataella phaffii GS115]CCA39218.2 eIF3 component of unknown function [Komagataella phaffii CBS 7435]